MKRIHTTDDAGQPVTVTVATSGSVAFHAGHVRSGLLGRSPRPALIVSYGLAKASDHVSFAGHTISGQNYADMAAGL